MSSPSLRPDFPLLARRGCRFGCVLPRRTLAGVRSVPGFTLVELLVVMAILGVLLGFIVPAVSSLKGAGDVSKAVYGIADIFEQARAYAMAKRTYVYVGLAEVDVSQPSGGPQRDGTGRLALLAIASKDGTRGYDVHTPSQWTGNGSAAPASFFVIDKVRFFDNLHLADLGNPGTTTGTAQATAMSRPTPSTDDPSLSYNLADPSCQSATGFSYPLGQAVGTGKYSFVKVIQFDPQGVARIQSATNADAVVSYMEVGLVQTHGTSAPQVSTPAVSGSVAAVQIECLTGSVHVYRP